MSGFELLLAFGSAVAIAGWVVASAYVLAIARRRADARATVAATVAELTHPDVRDLTTHERIERVRPLLARATRELVMHAAAADDTPADASEIMVAWLVDHWGIEALERDAKSHRTSRDKWRRTTALQLLNRLDDRRCLPLLTQAIDEADPDVAAVALSLLGRSPLPEAVDILLDALKRQRHPASRIAVQLDRSTQDLSSRLRPLLRDADPVVRLWAAALLGRYRDIDGLENELAALADDLDPRVRKAAVQSLGMLGDELAAAVATRLLVDPVPFVRATAARTIGKLERLDLAEEVVLLLGDQNWWVRFAAKECLESMGAEIWPVLVRSLDHPDRFVRNGAAEVFQNLGVLDSFIVMEAASDNPAGAKIEMLRRIVVAGGVRLTDSLVERAGAVMGPRVRELLSTIGLQQVRAA